ncbi:MAG: putative rane protein [Chthonomonadaceae bacterium]|nr:putative rane protein [Chthonomonadaceae bacterium]
MTAEKWKVIVVMLLATLAVSLGEALLSKGMKLTNVPSASGWAQTVLNRYVICGTVLMTAYFGLYMLALRWADLSFVLPLTAVSYLLGALLAKFYLGEHVSPTRWAGVLIITFGVIVVGLGERGGGTH